MKKGLSICLVLLFALLCFPAVTSAADSPAPVVATYNAAGSTLPSGTEIVFTGANFSSISAYFPDYNTGGFSSGVAIGAFDISLIDSATRQPVTGPVTLRFDYPGLRSYDKVEVFHISPMTMAGDHFPAVCYDGYFTFTTSSFSPFAFVLTRGSAPGGTTTQTAPQTGIY